MYARLADLYARYGEEEINQIADADGAGTPSPELVHRVLEDATSEIDAALAARYKLPIPVRKTPSLLVKIAATLAREALYSSAPPKEVKEQAKWAREVLKSIAEGVMRFGELETSDGGTALSDAWLKPTRHRMRWPGAGVRRRETGK
jgi:phage gp36-like protein